METREIQNALKRHGFDPGPVDGVMGPKTRKAIIAFKAKHGLRQRPFVGPVTRKLLMDEATAPAMIKPLVDLPWMRIALGYLGMAEIKGSNHNPKIVKWWDQLGLPFDDDETPWCAAFVNGVMMEAGLMPPPKYRAAARGWDWTGFGDEISEPVYGCIATFSRGKPNSGQGHIAFVAGRDQAGNLMCLGGNQGNEVSIRPFSTGRLLSYRLPLSMNVYRRELLVGDLPIIDSDGVLSTNEA